MPAMSLLVGCATGATITFVLTIGRWWWRRRQAARSAAGYVASQLRSVDASLDAALAVRSWRPLDQVDLTDHALPAMTMTIVDALPAARAWGLVDGLVAVHEIDRARDVTSLVAPHDRDRIDAYRRRVRAAGAIAAMVADQDRDH